MPGGQGPSGIVAARNGRAPNRHEGIADELIQQPAMGKDHIHHALKICVEHANELGRLQMLRHGGEAPDVTKQDADQPCTSSGMQIQTLLDHLT